MTYIMNEKNKALIVEPRDLTNLDKIILNVSKKLDNWKIVFYCGKGLKKRYVKQFKSIDIQIIELDCNNFTFEEYNNFMKSKKLWESMNSKYTLVFQADTYIFNTAPYTIDFFMEMDLSYIGGNMSYNWKELKFNNLNPTYKNFNGGLSLRKNKDMITIIDTFPPTNSDGNYKILESYGEDAYFTIGAYKLGLKVGDTAICQHFCIHCIIKDQCFGIHKGSYCHLDKKKLLKIYPELYNQPYI